MDTKRSSDQSVDEPNPKRPKIESAGSTSAKPESKHIFHSLPSDIVAKIIAYTPVSQWTSLETLDQYFLAATWIAWRQLRNIDVDRDLLIKSNDKSVRLILQKLVDRSPFLSSFTGMVELNSDVVSLLGKFEHLRSITLGDRALLPTELREELALERVVMFFKKTRSRRSLKEMQIFNVVHPEGNLTETSDQFATSFVKGRQIKSPLKLEKFAFSADKSLYVGLDTMDSTRLTELRVGKARIEPQQLTNVIERAPYLRRIELAFLQCYIRCNGQRLPANKKLLAALGSHENLTAIKFDHLLGDNDTNCTNFKIEFIQMLKTIGRRGKLEKLAFEDYFLRPATIDMNEICSTISNYIPYLQCIKLNVDGISDASVFGIVGLMELEEIDLMNSTIPVSENSIKQIGQLPRLKRLAVHHFSGVNPDAFKYLADAKAMMDLRIQYAREISADIFVKWADGFGSNLRCLMLLDIGCDAEQGLVRLLEKAVRMRVLILEGYITDQLLTTIAKSCPDLEILGVRSQFYISATDLQEIVDRCPRLKRLGGIDDEIRKELRFPKYRKVGDVEMEFSKYGFDDTEYD